jgi:glycine hydroxymethyltransferase
MHVIAAKAAAFKEALSDDFKEYSRQTLLNAKAICSSLKDNNFEVVSGDTSCHMLLIDLSNKEVTGKLAEKVLDDAGITCNKNSVPFDNKSPFVTSGIRIGTAAGTTRGFKEDEFKYIGNLISEVIDSLKKPDDEMLKTVEIVRSKVLDLCNKFPLYK